MNQACKLSSYSRINKFRQFFCRYAQTPHRVLALVLLCLAVSVVPGSNASAETRKLKLYYLHTGEKATIAYKKNGKFLPAGLKRINVFLRDWRRNEPTRMDTNLLDLIWEVYRKSGSRDYVHVISAYRSPATNNLLRKRGRGVAKKSQHTLGKALDFFLPDVKLVKLRNIGLLKQVGGVGYYPRSGSPFVHMDTGNVRHWPRMTRKQLVKVFPRGKTLHVPTDGKPLPGYNQAVATFNSRKSSSKKVELAKGTDKERRSFFQRLAALRNSDDEEGRANSAPAPRKVKTTPQTQTTKDASKPASPIDIPESPQTPPSLPLIAAIPIPRNAPRENLGSLENPVIASAETLIPDENLPVEDTLALVPVPQIRPVNTPILIAQAESSPQPVSSLANGRLAALDLEPPSGDNSRLASQTSEMLRVQLIAQAKSQLRTQLLNPPRPDALVGSSFQTALVSPRDDTNTSLTRSLLSSNANLRAIDDNLITGGQIPLPVANPQLLSKSPLRAAPIGRNLKNDGTIASPQPKPVALAALENSTGNKSADIAAVMAFPAPRPQLVASNSPVAQSATLSLALVDDGTDNLASPQNLRAMMEEQTRALVELQNASDNDVSPIIVAAIPTPSPLQLDEPDTNDEIQTAVSNTAELQKSNLPANLAQLTSAPKPLDDLSQVWFDQNRTGKFVLASSLTINLADELRAPAYGRAAIRQTPKTVLTAGFDLSGSIQTALKFSGRAINYQSFTKFN